MPVQNVFIFNSTACASVLSPDGMFICKLQHTSHLQCWCCKCCTFIWGHNFRELITATSLFKQTCPHDWSGASQCMSFLFVTARWDCNIFSTKNAIPRGYNPATNTWIMTRSRQGSQNFIFIFGEASDSILVTWVGYPVQSMLPCKHNSLNMS
jgi:hypothetical protein